MRGKHEARIFTHVTREALQPLANVCCVGSNEPGVIEPAVHERDVDVAAVVSQCLLRRCDVLPVLLTAGIAMMSGGNEADGMPDAVRMHPLQRVGQKRMPVAHADVDR